MKSGQCPKCKSSNVFMSKNGLLMGGTRTTVQIITGSFSQGAACDCYVCADCGYLENYIIDQERLNEVRQKWNKVT